MRVRYIDRLRECNAIRACRAKISSAAADCRFVGIFICAENNFTTADCCFASIVIRAKNSSATVDVH
jgi:hypothetical protein